MSLPDCLSLQECRDVSQVRAAVTSRVHAIKQEVARLVREQANAVVVEVRLDVLSTLLDLAAEGQALRDRRAQKQRADRPGDARHQESAELIAQGLTAHQIVERLGLSRTYIGPIAARIKRFREAAHD